MYNSGAIESVLDLLKKEFEDFVKFRVESVTSKLNLVSREEFEIQKKVIDKLQRELLKLKKKNSN